jgi:hypothetical protein
MRKNAPPGILLQAILGFCINSARLGQYPQRITPEKCGPEASEGIATRQQTPPGLGILLTVRRIASDKHIEHFGAEEEVSNS